MKELTDCDLMEVNGGTSMDEAKRLCGVIQEPVITIYPPKNQEEAAELHKLLIIIGH